MKKSNDIDPWARIEAATDSDAQDPELTPPTPPSPLAVDRQVANEKGSADSTDELTPPTASNPLELDHDIVNMKRFTNELALPNPSNPPEVDHDILYNEKRFTNELTPPTPFNPPEVDHDIVNKKIAANSIETMKKSDDIDGWAWLEAAADSDVNELTPPTPFEPPEVDHDIINEKIGANAMEMTKPGAHTSLEPRDEELGKLQSIVEPTQDGVLVGNSEIPSPVTPSTNIRDDEDEAERDTSPANETTSLPLPITASVRMSTFDPRTSAFGHGGNDDSTPFVPEAVLVQDGDDEVVIATIPEEEKIGFFERKGRLFALGMCLLLVLVAIIISVFSSKETEKVVLIPSLYPSMEPSSPPSFVPGPTLQIVQERGHVRCGLRNVTISEGGFELKLCHAIAAVILGNPDSFEPIPVTATDRFQLLQGRFVDLLLSSETHTIEREVREISTGVGFEYSSPYFYDGLVYYGNETFVQCAQDSVRYAECAFLRICVNEKIIGKFLTQPPFPSDFFLKLSSDDDMVEQLLNETCNVVLTKQSHVPKLSSMDAVEERNFVVGDELVTKEPRATVTRNNDAEFSDVVNWVVQATIYGEEKGLMKDLQLCQPYTNLTGRVSDLDFMNAVYCVGSYGEIVFGAQQNKHGMNTINNGTTGMLYAIPFGDIGGDPNKNIEDTAGGYLLRNIRNVGILNCGVIAPKDSSDNTMNNLKSLSVAYCRVVAAGLFNGLSWLNATDDNFGGVNLTTYTEEEDGYAALDNYAIDVLAGARTERKYDFESQSLRGFHFSTPYYYGDEPAGDDVSFFSLATRDGDGMFSSFVNSMVVATIYAEEKGIVRERYLDMPKISLFGSELSWSLRDSISWLGGRDQIYSKVFQEEGGRGRNTLNKMNTSQLNSFPGFTLADN